MVAAAYSRSTSQQASVQGCSVALNWYKVFSVAVLQCCTFTFYIAEAKMNGSVEFQDKVQMDRLILSIAAIACKPFDQMRTNCVLLHI